MISAPSAKRSQTVVISSSDWPRTDWKKVRSVRVTPFARLGDSDSPYQANMKSYGASGQVDWDLGRAALTSITAYRWWDWDPKNDGDATGLPVVTKSQQANRQRQFSQEIRLASKGDNRIDYVFGAYYFWQIVKGKGAVAYGSAAPNWYLPTTNATVASAALNGFEADSTSTPTTKDGMPSRSIRSKAPISNPETNWWSARPIPAPW